VPSLPLNLPQLGRTAPIRASTSSDDASTATATSASYTDLLRSSALIGVASLLTLLIGVVRTKALAVLLGPAGFGLLGMFVSIADMSRSLVGLGINSSGVRQIADAAASSDPEQVARTAFVLRRLALLLGAVVEALVVVLASSISTITFGSAAQTSPVALLSLAVMLGLIAEAQTAIVQGTRRIADLAKAGVVGSLLGTAISIALVYWLRQDGVVPSLVAVAAMSVVATWWYSRKIAPQTERMPVDAITSEAASLIKLGLVFMTSAFLTLSTGYAVRTIVLGKVGLEAAGYYQAAWTLAGLYVGFVLQAMGAGFYPRLVGVARNDLECNRLVNEQARVNLLLGAPGVLGTLTLAPLIITLLYSDRFHLAVDVLRWTCLGMALRVSSWPMGFIIVAKGRQTLFFIAELAWSSVGLLLAWTCITEFGLVGAGIAFFGSYVFHWLMIYAMVRTVSGFRWSAANARASLLMSCLIAGVFAGFYALPASLAIVLGIIASIATTIHSLRSLASLTNAGGLAALVHRAVSALRRLLRRRAEW
jgi:PST family polysaccharide transporter